MMDRDKVIKALECCTKKVCCYNDTEKECPYWELCGSYEDAFEDCTTALSKDALALLKAQEPVVMVGEELNDTELIEKIRKAPIVMKPIVDAAPVAHGQWLGRRYDFKEYKYVIVPYDATTFDNPDDLFCSVCNTPALLNGAENDVPSNYCPHCGARMDGERRDSE